MAHLTSRIHQIITKILLDHPEIDLCKTKKRGQSFDAICQRLTEQCRRSFTIDLLILFVSYYYPIPTNFKERLDQLDQQLLDQLVQDAWSSSYQDKRRVLEDLLTEEELSPPTLGEALRVSGYPETSFYLSSCQVSDYSSSTIARAILRQAKTSSERQYAKTMILQSLQDELAMQLIFLPLDTLCDDLLLIESPTDLTDNYCYNFVCPISERHIYLNLPDCYRFTPSGCTKISLFIAADCALSCLLWQWLRISTCLQYYLLVSSINLDQAKSLLEMKYFVDLFLCPYYCLLKDEIGDHLASRYTNTLSSLDANLFTTLYQHDKEGVRRILAECLIEMGQLNCNLVLTKIRLHLKASPELRKTLAL